MNAANNLITTTKNMGDSSVSDAVGGDIITYIAGKLSTVVDGVIGAREMKWRPQKSAFEVALRALTPMMLRLRGFYTDLRPILLKARRTVRHGRKEVRHAYIC